MATDIKPGLQFTIPPNDHVIYTISYVEEGLVRLNWGYKGIQGTTCFGTRLAEGYFNRGLWVEVNSGSRSR